MAESEMPYRALFDATTDAVLVVDESGVVVLANAGCEALLGHPPETLRGRSVEQLVPGRFPAHARQRAGYVAHPAARSMGRGLELFARHADGREIPVDISLTPLLVQGRRLFGCSLRDLRGRPHGLDSIRVQATALRSAANGIVITDRGGVITWVNPAACRITGYSLDELVGQHTRILRSGQHDTSFYANLWQTVTRGETWSGTIVNRRKDGTLYHEEQTIAPVLDELGEITHFIAIKQDVTEQRRIQEALAAAHAELAARLAQIEELNAQLREQAISDPLTGLHNRRYLQEVAGHEVARALRTGAPVAVCALDLDHFKRINDTHGHATGDLVLQRLASVLRSQVRASDLVCRVGGEEFLVVLPGATLRAALLRTEEWRKACAATAVTSPAGTEVRCTVSIGVAMHHPEESSLEPAWQRADAALYDAKRAGRDRVEHRGQAGEA